MYTNTQNQTNSQIVKYNKESSRNENDSMIIVVVVGVVIFRMEIK